MNESSNKANAFNNMSANFGFAVAKVVKNLQVCKKNRIFLCFFARRVIAEHLTAKRDARILSVHAEW